MFGFFFKGKKCFFSVKFALEPVTMGLIFLNLTLKSKFYNLFSFSLPFYLEIRPKIIFYFIFSDHYQYLTISLSLYLQFNHQFLNTLYIFKNNFKNYFYIKKYILAPVRCGSYWISWRLQTGYETYQILMEKLWTSFDLLVF